MQPFLGINSWFFKYVDANGDKCGSCIEGADSGCFLSSRAFFLENSCFNRAEDRSSIYAELSDGVVCREEFREDSCEDDKNVFSAVSVEDCRDSWVLGECSNAEKMQKLEGWCTKSNNGPDGEYTIPLLTFKEYDGTSCGSSDYINILLPDEGGSCKPLSFKSAEGSFVTGSRKVKCDGSVFSAVRYDSADCSGEALTTSFDGSFDQCPEDKGDLVYTNDCAAPGIYCKAMSGSDTNQPIDTGISTSGNNDESAGVNIVPGGLLLMGLAILSWVA